VEFENDIEEEIDSSERERKNYRHKPFMALKKVMAKDYVIPNKLKIKVEKIFK
jgi:putative ATP-dependent endonuclease of OLD family